MANSSGNSRSRKATDIFSKCESVEFYLGKIYYLDYDTLRGGNFEALELLPATKNVVLGLVTTKSATLEEPEELKAKVLEAAEVIARGDGSSVEEALLRIGVSPQCGFASTLKGNSLTMDEMAAKLSLVRQLADEIE
jgi:methionine synthase II (cobalamin-independent)